MTSDKLRLCPQCGSASVNFSSLVGGSATCRACHWEGRTEDCFTSDVHHVGGTAESTALAFSNDYRKLFQSKSFAVDLVRFLVRWGFVSAVDSGSGISLDNKLALRYINAIAQSGLKAIIQEREKIELEERSGT